MQIASFQLCCFVLVAAASGLDKGPTISASEGEEPHRFGASLAIDGDLVVVGDGRREAYVFRVEPDMTRELAKIINSDAPDPGAIPDGFGTSVSISGDLIVVGADGEDTLGTNAGAAYLFRVDGNSVTEVAKITASDGESGDRFGTSVSISGNLIVVGAPRVGNSVQPDVGRAYVFRVDGTSVDQVWRVLSSHDSGARSGTSVSISGDLIVVGAPGQEAAGEAFAGVAHVYRVDGDDVSFVSEITASDAGANDQFGTSVSISGDLIVAGAPSEDTLGSDAGAAYIFRVDGNTVDQKANLTASDGVANDNFGEFVSVDGSLIAVGSDRFDAVYLFRMEGNSVNQEAKLTRGPDDLSGGFGISVSISGNLVVCRLTAQKVHMFRAQDNGELFACGNSIVESIFGEECDGDLGCSDQCIQGPVPDGSAAPWAAIAVGVVALAAGLSVVCYRGQNTGAEKEPVSAATGADKQTLAVPSVEEGEMSEVSST